MEQERLHVLMVRGLAGDQNAYHFFLKEVSCHLRAFFRRRLEKAPDEVEDLVQETLLAIHNQRHTYEVTQPLAAWVYAIARYKLVDLFRRQRIRDAVHEPLEEEHELFAATDNEAHEAHRDIEQLLQHLPHGQRIAITQVKLEGLTVKEAAVTTGMSESLVKVNVHRGLKALAQRIRGEK